MEQKSDNIENITELEEAVMTDTVESSLVNTLRKSIFVALGIGVLIAIGYMSPLRHLLDEPQNLAEKIQALGPWGSAAFTLIVIILVTIGVPRLAICAVGGMAFGFWQGLLWSQVGTMLAYYGVFLFVRWGGRDLLKRYVPKVEKFSGMVDKGGISAVILARQVPLYGMLINIMLGLSPVRHIHFLIGTFVGILPEGIPCVLVGSGITQKGALMKAEYIAWVLIAIIMVWALLSWHLKRRKKMGKNQ